MSYSAYRPSGQLGSKLEHIIITFQKNEIPLFGRAVEVVGWQSIFIVILCTLNQCTVYKYIQGRRLTLAAQKLVDTEQPIVEIAYEAHYDSQQAFTLAFKQFYGCTPRNYRKNGVFYLKQSKIRMMRSLDGYRFMYYFSGGKFAA